tara:strand:+ start:353 stop:754 length:402 start_codon:yes stop_codon:yes gene_type:complete
MFAGLNLAAITANGRNDICPKKAPETLVIFKKVDASGCMTFLPNIIFNHGNSSDNKDVIVITLTCDIFRKYLLYNILLAHTATNAKDSAKANCMGSNFCFFCKNIPIMGPSLGGSENAIIANIKYIFSFSFTV